ncbi:hypothetical protein [Paraburkholderia kirstenboschensis]|uniref:Uncharacterized protein n=1 Tax=Paraburkholderia kirstenboschensis TaxID=1245436 RepID=A0ABZ0ECN4_9BURK|nr:hypothetical protein [Paraburkholderia kirstenboschensis]WOD14279.1 hypothetical protein RW095_01905 [Paraburkholderia kirstenboschensis]
MPVVKKLRQPSETERFEPGGNQFDRQSNAVEVSTYVGNDGRILIA